MTEEDQNPLFNLSEEELRCLIGRIKEIIKEKEEKEEKEKAEEPKFSDRLKALPFSNDRVGQSFIARVGIKNDKKNN